MPISSLADGLIIEANSTHFLTGGTDFDKEYETKWNQVRIKLIALVWYWVTIIFWCQTSPKIHCSPAIYNVQDKTKNILSKLVKVN